MLKHAVIVKWSDEDQGYIATIPGIQGLSAFGKSQKKALLELNNAAEAFFASLKEHRKIIPLPDKVSHYSGQLRLRMPKSLHAELAEAAENDGVSLNTYIVTLLSKRSVQHAIMKKMERLVIWPVLKR